MGKNHASQYANFGSLRMFTNFDSWSQSTPKYLFRILYIAEEGPIKLNL